MTSSIANPFFGVTVSEKLSRTNHAMWKPQVLAVVQGARLEGHLTGATPMPDVEIDGKSSDGKDTKVSEPAYEEWFSRDQQVLGFILGSLAQEVLSQVAAKETAADLWSAVEDMFSSQNRARALNTRLALATTKKGTSTISEYVGKMKGLGDQMIAAGRRLEEEELVEYILTGLDEDFNPIVSALIARKETVTVSEAFQQLLAFETRMDMLGLGRSSSSVNTVNRGGRGNNAGRGHNNGGRSGSGRGYNGGGRGNRRGNFNQRQGSNGGGGRGNFFRTPGTGGNNSKPVC
jgi:hypothetical protein